MKQEEKWPVFQTSPKLSTKFSEEGKTFNQKNNEERRKSGDLFEEMSGMVTLKRKAKETSNGVNNTQQFSSHAGLQNLF